MAQRKPTKSAGRGKEPPKKPEPAKGKSTGKPPTATDYLAHLRKIAAAEKEDEDDFGFMDDEPGGAGGFSEFIPTGCLAANKLLGGRNGGWPVGGISECAAWEHVGKSTLLDQSIAECQRIGGVAALIDSEKARNMKYTRALGVDTKQLIVMNAKTIEQVFIHTDRLIAFQRQRTLELIETHGKKPGDPPRPPPLMIVWDALAGTPTNEELEGDADDKNVATAARVIKRNFRRMVQPLRENRIAFVYANHFYEGIGGYGGKKAYGGGGPRYFSHVRLWMTRTDSVKAGESIVGHKIQIETKKNRIRGYVSPVETALTYGAGIDNSFTLFEWGKIAKSPAGKPWIALSGSWQQLHLPGEEPIAFQHKHFGLARIFAEQPKAYEMMAIAFLEAP